MLPSADSQGVVAVAAAELLTQQSVQSPVEDAAHAMAIGPPTAYQLLAAGSLPPVRIGRARRIAFAAVRGYVADLGAEHDGGPH